MGKSSDNQTLTNNEWLIVRDFTEDRDGHTLPRYEAKLLEEGRPKYIENGLVLVKVTQPNGRREKRYRIPREVFEKVTDSLP